MAGSQRIAAIRVEAVGDQARLAAIFMQWRALARAAAAANVLYAPEMGLAAFRHLEGREHVTWLVAWRGDTMVGIWPVTERALFPGLPMKAVMPWHHALGFLTTPLIHRDHLAPVAEAFAAHLAEPPGARIFLQRAAAWAGPVQQALMAAFNARGGHIRTLASYDRAALMTQLSGEAYLREVVGPGRVKTARRLGRRLAETGAMAFDCAETPAALTAAAEEFLALEDAGWKGRRGTAMTKVPGEAAFLREAVAGWGKAGSCRILRLTLDGRCIASLVILCEQDRAWLWKIAFDEAYGRYSPGVLLVIEATGMLLAGRGIALGDSCAPSDYPMIDRLWRQRLPLADMMVAMRPGRTPTRVLVALEKGRRAARGLVKKLVRGVSRADGLLPRRGRDRATPGE